MIVWALPAYAGAWTKEVGEVYLKTGADLYAASRYAAPGEPQTATSAEEGRNDGKYLGQQYGLYGEAGVLPLWKTALSLSLPLVIGTHRTTYEDAFGSTDVRAQTIRTGDLRVTVQTALHPKLPLSLSLDAKLPTYRNRTVGEGYPVYQRLFPKPGDGQIDLGAMLYAGASVGTRGFAEIGAGLLHRTEFFVGGPYVDDPLASAIVFSDGLRLSAKIGHPLGLVLPIVGIDALLSPQPTPYTRSALDLSLSALIDLAPGVAIEPRVAAQPWARRTSQGFSAGVGLSYRTP